MKHFLGYKADGTFGSIETYGPGGWPPCTCSPNCTLLSNPNCSYPPVVHLRDSRAKNNPEILGYYLYDCPCPTTDPVCEASCYSTFYGTHFVVNNLAVAKPSCMIHLDSGSGFAAVADGTTVDQTPGQTVTIKVVGALVPDLEDVNVGTSGVDITPEGDDIFTLAFSGGESATKVLTTPGQGLKSTLSIGGKYIRPTTIYLRGWA